ncbi:CHAT domain-containing protein [Streptomyces sp. Ag109_G2-15]|uniref:CHAT domain-containing protein n=1 Tax=Streptomyces sp. Ag109_G2-15 TaxID=1938850 RepID=UPI000BDBC260|nr:CHAT domain-containing protein [Streptomyces sp. Ag109_G2-15]SOD82536.1 CHAT domain-containing protein [Streptomyces sp. Ag109_G2-15]
MSDEESGGVRGLRAWAVDAAERVKRLIPAMGAGAVAPRAYDASVGELDQLARLLDHDPALRSAVGVWLAGALAQRHLAGGGEPADRERAETLLRDARDPGTVLGATATEEDRRWAALFLLPLISPIQPQRGGFGAAPDLSAFLEWVTRVGPAGMASVAAEIEELTAEVVELPLPPEFRGQLRQMQTLFTTLPGPGYFDPITNMMPAGDPYADLFRRTMDGVFGTTVTPTGGQTDAPGAGRTADAEPSAAAGPSAAPDASAASGPSAEPGASAASGPSAEPGASAASDASAVADAAAGPSAAPGAFAASGPSAAPGACTAPDPSTGPDASRAPDPSAAPDVSTDPDPSTAPDPSADSNPPSDPKPTLTADDIRRLAAAMDAVNAATDGLDGALKSDDPAGAINELLRRLYSVQDLPPPGPDPTSAMEAMRALLLNISSGAGGSLQDQSAGRAHMERIVGHFEKLAGSLPPGMGDPGVWGRAFLLYSRVRDAGEAEDVQALRDVVDEAEALEKSVPEGHSFRFVVLMTLGAAYGRLGALTRDEELMLRSLPYLEKGMSGIKESGLPFADELPVPYLPDIDLLRAALTRDTAAAKDHDPVPPPPGASTEDLHRSALSVALRYSLTRDRADLDRLIRELELVRDGVREGRAPRIAAEALWQLAMAYRERGVGDDDVRDIAALEAAKEALTALAADVLLQTGAEHGLLTARAGASRGVQAALWAASQGRLHEAVAVLELGRALVLHAASTSSAVPELLDEGGHHALAEAWRAVDATQRPDAADDDGVPDELPSTLRRQALEALGYRRDGSLLNTPTLSELADGVEESGADALVYLVPGEGENPGVVIAVGPRLGAGVGVRSLLSGAENGPLEHYLDATAVRDGGRNDPSAEQAWEEALSALCDWAYEVLAPLLTDVGERLTADGDPGDRPLRLVLVPCGRLGIVPWHAARLPAEAPHDYLCQSAVISYAASGSQFLRTLKRAPREPAAAPVLLADPTMDLTHAEVEVIALRDAFYRQARMCGGLFQVPEEELAPGTPEDVLGFLADGTSLLHVASHGSAGTRPTVSALHLADADADADGNGNGDGGGPGTAPDPGLLTVTRLLDRPGQQAAEDGPLVVLSACQTDLSTRDHDEALTLTTAFVAGGARDVVGSRWTTQDSASALLMAVFHHHLTVDGLSPVDALRAAQLWMLDPHRTNPGSLGGELLRQLERPDLDRIALWAAFIHQGHPGAARTGTRGETATATGGGNA